MPSLLYVVTEDWYFVSHRLALAERARAAGYTVTVATRVSSHGETIRNAGLELVALPFERSLRRPWCDLAVWFALRRVLRERRPDIVHAVSLKPILLGLAAGAERQRCIAAFTGLGYLFTARGAAATVLRRCVQGALRRLVGHGDGAWTLVQNADDGALLAAAGIGAAARSVLIAGSGVELQAFPRCAEPLSPVPLVILPARVLVEKGVREFVAAAAELRARGIAVRCVLVGRHDTHNPGALPRSELDAAVATQTVEWWDHRDDMAAVFAAASVVCLPSYREGLPKALLEAGAVARAVVTTDVPGCRDVVEHDVSGMLVPAADAAALAAALAELLGDPARRARHAAALHERVARCFSAAAIAAQTLALYARVLDETTEGGGT